MVISDITNAPRGPQEVFYRKSKVETQGGLMSLRDVLTILLESTVDEDLIQRILVDWDEITSDSYMTSMLNGTNLTSVFVFANIESIRNDLNNKIEDYETEENLTDLDQNEVKEKISALKENLEYFENLLNDGNKYLLIDGAHRKVLFIKAFVDKTYKFPKNIDCEIQLSAKSPDGVEIPLILGGKTLRELDDKFAQWANISDYFLDSVKEDGQTPQWGALTCFITKGSIEELQKIFVNSNKGLILQRMELRICNMSVMARYIRSFHSQPTIMSFFKVASAFAGKESNKDHLKKKGDLLFITKLMAYYLNKVKPSNKNPSTRFFNDDYYDSMFEYDFPTDKVDRDIITKTMKILAKGYLDEFKKQKTSNVKYYIKANYSELLNVAIFLSILITGHHPNLKTIGKKIVVCDGKEQYIIRNIIEIIENLIAEEKYILAADGGKQIKYTPLGQPELDKKGQPVYVENEHGFGRRNSSLTVKNMEYKVNKFMDELTTMNLDESTILDNWVKAGYITLIDQKRTPGWAEKTSMAASTGFTDYFTKKQLTLGDVRSNQTAASHIVAHSKGGTDMVIGNAKMNRKQGTDPMYDHPQYDPKKTDLNEDVA